MLKLNFNLEFNDLYSLTGLRQLNAAWGEYLRNASEELFARLQNVVSVEVGGKEESELILKLAPYLDDFIAELFNIRNAVSLLSVRHQELSVISRVKRLFIQRVAVKGYVVEDELKI